MSQTFKQRSALVRIAERGLNRKRNASIILAVCVMVVVAFMVGKFFQQIMQVMA